MNKSYGMPEILKHVRALMLDQKPPPIGTERRCDEVSTMKHDNIRATQRYAWRVFGQWRQKGPVDSARGQSDLRFQLG